MRFLKVLTAAVFIFAGVAGAAPELKLSGYLDGDIWSDLKGNFFSNEELDLGLQIQFSENVSANLYTTILAGTMPAGTARSSDRWARVSFDGLDITFDTRFGTFAVGDLVYKYGKFNYYFYKRLSMITAESFTRGLSYTLVKGKFSQIILAGAADTPDKILGYNIPVDGDEPEPIISLSNVADFGGKSILKPVEGHEIGLVYGIRSDIKNGFYNNGSVYIGLQYSGAVSEALSMKFDAGYTNIMGEFSTYAILLEPVLTLGNFSTALTFYTFIDPDSAGTNFVNDEMLLYVEPGYTFNEYLGAGFPLELHTGDVSSYSGSTEFWAVPTMYIYPAEGIQWWLWGQIASPLQGGEPYYGLGSEIIVEF